MTLLYDDGWLWLVIVAFIIAFVLAFGLGANDVANAFGTSVGAKVITIRQACILGTIFEIAGAVLIGAKVSNTIRKGIVDPALYTNGTEEMFMAGNTAALSGSCIWLMFATFFSLPVSGTHSIVGATLGFHLVAHGVNGVNGIQLILIVCSWFASPLLSGLFSATIFKVVDIFILKREKPLVNGFRLLPIFYAVTVAVNLFSIFYKGSELLHFNKIPLYGTFILTFCPAILIAIFVHFVVVPRQRKNIEKKLAKLADYEEATPDTHTSPTSMKEVYDQQISVSVTDIPKTLYSVSVIDTPKNINSSEPQLTQYSALDMNITPVGSQVKLYDNGIDEKPTATVSIEDGTEPENDENKAVREEIKDKPETAVLFSFLQVLTAIFGSFAHGGNDVSNAIGPLVALWITATTGSSAQSAPVPIWVLVYGGFGISVGLWVWGRKVMKTIGEDLTKITPSSGFCIEIGSALTVLIASNVGIPISTTHCKVGSVVITGRVRSRESVDMKLFRNIIFAWFVTLPVAGGLSALVMLLLKAIMKF